MTARRTHLRWTTVLALTLVWWVLWGTWSAISLVGGALVALSVSLLFPLPALRVHGRIRPLGALRLLGRLLVDIVVATVEVAWVTVHPPRPLRNALVAVPLRTDSDLVLTAVVELVSLVPGSVVVEVDRARHTLYLHVLAVRSPADLDRARDAVLAQEQRVLRALVVGPGGAA